MAEYVGSGEYGKRGKEYNPNVGRYDYFEAPVTINGKGYIVSFDVASCADVNNYRTHRLVDIAITPQGPSNQIHQAGLSSAGSAGTPAASNITQGETAVNSESQNAAQGAAGAGGITTEAQATQSEGGVLNAPQSVQAEQAGQSPRQTTLDIYQNRGTRQTESTVVDTDPTTHTAAQQEVINDYQSNVDEGLVSFANRVRTLKDGNYRNKITYSISEVSPRQTQDIKAITGVDTTGFENIITGDAVTHIDSRHGVDGEHDHSMADTNDLARIGYVLDNYDSVALDNNADGTPRSSPRWMNRDNTGALQVRFQKKSTAQCMSSKRCRTASEMRSPL